MMHKLHGIIFAYRSNADLRELTQPRNTCSIPYGGRYRIVDFMLSNFVNAGISDVGLIVHSHYQSLLDHVGSGKDWDLSRKHGGLRILPPFGFAGKRRDTNYDGRMDALAGVYSYLENIRQPYVILSAGNNAMNLDVDAVFDRHIESGADITAVCSPVPRGEPKNCDYFTLDHNGVITDVAIKPMKPAGHESLEVYVMSKDLLISLVDYCIAHNLSSFGEAVLQGMKDRLRLVAYEHTGYVARLQSLNSYYARSMDLLDPAVRAELFNPDRPIKTKDRSDPSTYYGPESKSINSLVADGCIIDGEVENCILFRGVHVEKGAKVQNCILMQGTVIHADAVLKYAITDKNVEVNAGRMLMGHESYPLAIAKGAIV